MTSNQIKLYLEIPVLWLLSKLPNAQREKWETRLLWRLKRVSNMSGKKDFAKALKELDETSTCIDLGANLGDVTEVLLSTKAKVVAFEPDPWAFGKLKERFKGRENLELYNAAVGAKDEESFLLRDPNFNTNKAEASQGGSIGNASLLWGSGEPERIPVDVLDIRRILRNLGSPIDLIKIDVEGSEVEILECLLDSEELGLVKTMFVETHEAQMPVLRDRTKSLRKRIRRIENPKIYLNWS